MTRTESSLTSPRKQGADVLILCYHAVSPIWPAELSLSPESLAEQLEYLAGRGYRGITFTEAVLGEVAGKAIAITFDDGYASTFRLARPILERFGMPGTVFVPTDYIGGGPMSWPGIDQWIGGDHEKELLPMSWDDARELADAGWEIGSHTKSHPRLTEIPDDQLAEELVESRRTCEERLDRPCQSIAYPYGDHDDRVVAATSRAGYSSAATLPSRTPVPAPLAWPRVGVFYHDSMRVFRVKVSPTMRRLRRSRAWRPLVEPLRKLTGRSRA
jgi:peptidoglycan/xylan/chitin deacetylase (PgdA/CDA1 family)